MIDGSEKRNRVAFELQNSHVCEKGSNVGYVSSRFFLIVLSVVSNIFPPLSLVG